MMSGFASAISQSDQQLRKLQPSGPSSGGGVDQRDPKQGYGRRISDTVPALQSQTLGIGRRLVVNCGIHEESLRLACK